MDVLGALLPKLIEKYAGKNATIEVQHIRNKKRSSPRSKSTSGWISFVKQVQKQYNLSYKEALKKASQLRRQ